MMELQVKGTQSFMDKEIPVVEGGFGEGKRSLTDKAISKVHTQPTREIRKSINRNIKRFKEGVDFIDLKDGNEITNNLLVSLGYTKMEISKATNIYLLSERGYAKLIKIMDTDLAWEIHDKLIDEYFTMREVINSNEQLKAKLLLDIYNGGQEGIVASRELVELEKKPLLETIETQKPKVSYHDKVLNGDKLVTTTDIAKDLGMTARELHNKLHDMKIIFKTGNHWTFYAKYQTRIPLFADYQIGEHGQILKWTERGRKWIIKLLNEQKEKDLKKENLKLQDETLEK